MVLGAPLLALFLPFLYFLLHLLNAGLFRDVLLVILSQDPLILQQLLRQYFALFLQL